MKNIQPDIAIFGAGVAGLWVFNRLRAAGYNAVLLEANSIGGAQSVASQGIIHSGLKYALAGKVNALARSISAMPDLWRTALRGEGSVDLSAARTAAHSQHLLIPSGFMGGLVKHLTQQVLGEHVYEIPKAEWPDDITRTGFKGSVIHMGEPVLNVPSVIRALAEPYRDYILKIDDTAQALKHIDAQLYIFTAGAGNHDIATAHNHDSGLETQKRPLLMGMMKHAPYPLYAHLVGTSEKPVATITTHQAEDGALVWYLGGSVAERSKDADQSAVYKAIKKSFAKYFPALDLSNIEWATLPIDRVEGKSNTDGWMPDTPTIHERSEQTADGEVQYLYCWPTKLTFAPMLSDMLIEKIAAKRISPSSAVMDVSGWDRAEYTKAPWDLAQWDEA